MATEVKIKKNKYGDTQFPGRSRNLPKIFRLKKVQNKFKIKKQK